MRLAMTETMVASTEMGASFPGAPSLDGVGDFGRDRELGIPCSEAMELFGEAPARAILRRDPDLLKSSMWCGLVWPKSFVRIAGVGRAW